MSDMSEIIKTILVPINVTKQTVEDILVTAFDGSYGGAWYWIDKYVKYDNLGNRTEASTWDNILAGGISEIKPEDDSVTRVMNLEKFLIGLEMWLTKHGTDRSLVEEDTIDPGQIDAGDADNIVQYAIFGELIYG